MTYIWFGFVWKWAIDPQMVKFWWRELMDFVRLKNSSKRTGGNDQHLEGWNRSQLRLVRLSSEPLRVNVFGEELETEHDWTTESLNIIINYMKLGPKAESWLQKAPGCDRRVNPRPFLTVYTMDQRTKPPQNCRQFPEVHLYHDDGHNMHMTNMTCMCVYIYIHIHIRILYVYIYIYAYKTHANTASDSI